MQNVIRLIKVLSYRPDLVTDENRDVLVTNRGAFNVVTGEVGYTGPDDYITDTYCIGVPYEDPDEQKIEFLETEFAAKIQPDPDLCKCFLEHRSTCLIGGSSQKWIETDIGIRKFLEYSYCG